MHSSSPYYEPGELRDLGATAIGRHVTVSRRAQFYGFQGSIGHRVRVDDFTIIKGRVDIGNYVHISAFCLLGGAGGSILFDDFSTTAAYVGVYTSSDDYASPLLTNSVVPADLKRGITGDVRIGRGVVIGAHCVILPNAVVGDYATVGALCIVNGELGRGSIYVTGAGRPRRIGQRDIASIRRAEVEALRRLAEEG
jgi:acetyltransferase-like isoleucine patch superfamily enzyme